MFKTSISLVLPLTLELAKAKDSLSQLFLKLAWVCCLLVLLGHTQNLVGGGFFIEVRSRALRMSHVSSGREEEKDFQADGVT